MDERIFDQAVTIAAAFVSNGDIRLGGSTKKDSIAMAMLHDVIVAAYAVLEDAQKNVH